MIAAIATNPIENVTGYYTDRAREPILRTRLQFAEQEIVIPEGPHKGELFRAEVQPFAALLLREMDSRRWLRYAITGCVQSGKSFVAFVIQCLYEIFERRNNVILGVPTVDEIGRDKWNNEIMPAIMASRYAGLMPKSGTGSRGGWGSEVRFGHGTQLKIMGGTGGDEKRSSYTAPVVLITEADKMDQPGETSREADPVTQMGNRSGAWDLSERLMCIECTVSHTEGRIWQEYTGGSASRIACPCPYCREYVTPERDSLRGWQEAMDALEAEEKAHFVCPACEHPVTADERAAMNRAAVLVHKGQEIDQDGVVTGPLPRTHTLGFRWNAFNNLFWSAAAIGVREWEGRAARDRDSAEKELRQFYWAWPWDPPDIKMNLLTPEKLRERAIRHKRGIVPPGTVGISAAIDTGKRQLDWTAIAWREDSSGFIIDYGEQTTNADQIGLEVGLRLALLKLQTYLESGWRTGDGTILRPSQVWIDSGYPEHTRPVYDFCELFNPDCEPGAERYRPSKGYGEGQGFGVVRYSSPKRVNDEIRYIGKQFHFSRIQRTTLVHVNGDYWKSDLHTRLGMEPDEPGAIVLFETADAHGHDAFIDQILAEEQIEKWIPGKGTRIVWERIRRKNHKLDATYAAVAAGEFVLAEGLRVSGAKPESWFAKQKRRKR